MLLVLDNCEHVIEAAAALAVDTLRGRRACGFWRPAASRYAPRANTCTVCHRWRALPQRGSFPLPRLFTERFSASNVESIGQRSARMCHLGVEPEQNKSVCVEATFARVPPQLGRCQIKTRRRPGGTSSGVGFLWSGAALNPDRLLFPSSSPLHSGPPSVL